MDFIREKIRVMCEKLNELKITDTTALDGFMYTEAPYKTENNIPAETTLMPFDPKQCLKGRDNHYWLTKKLITPPVKGGKQLILEIKTTNVGTWDARNPQCIVYKWKDILRNGYQSYRGAD